jgi:hypothetical protein
VGTPMTQIWAEGPEAGPSRPGPAAQAGVTDSEASGDSELTEAAATDGSQL